MKHAMDGGAGHTGNPSPAGRDSVFEFGPAGCCCDRGRVADARRGGFRASPIYPWYRAIPQPGVVNLAQFPQALLKSSTTTAGWHNLGMEWKERVAWFAPIAITMAAYVSIKYRSSIREHPQVRKAVLVFVIAAFAAAGVAGYFGAMINKHAPVNGGSTIHWMGGSH